MSHLFSSYERQKFAEAEQLTCQPSIKCTEQQCVRPALHSIVPEEEERGEFHFSLPT